MKPKSPTTNLTTNRPRIIDHNKPQATRADIAQHFGVNIRTVDKWLAENPPIPHYRRGGTVRFSIAQVEDHFQQQQKATSN